MEVADLNSLAIFAKVVEANGFLEAARRLMPKSTVSRRVADLERFAPSHRLANSWRRARSELTHRAPTSSVSVSAMWCCISRSRESRVSRYAYFSSCIFECESVAMESIL